VCAVVSLVSSALPTSGYIKRLILALHTVSYWMGPRMYIRSMKTERLQRVLFLLRSDNCSRGHHMYLMSLWITVTWSIDTEPSLWGRVLILTPHYEVKHWYRPLTMRCSIDTEPSLWGRVLILSPHYEVEHWYWPLTMRWSIDTEPSLWGVALIPTPHYEV